MKKILLVSLLIGICQICIPQIYSFNSIPSELKKNADAVVRTSQCLYTVSRPGNAVMKIKEAITIFNENADSYRYLAVNYDKFTKVNYITGNVYNEKGTLVKSMKYSDINDMSVMTGGSFYTDDRKKVLRFPLFKYPFTVEYEYEIEFSSILSYPSWNFQDSKSVSVENSGIQFILPKGMRLRYYEKSLRHKVDSVVLDGRKIYTWQENNIAAKSQVRTLTAALQPVLEAAPLEFEYAGIKGSMSSWKDFGEWAYNINKNRDALSEDEENKVKSLVSGYADSRDKVKAVYEYMQSRTRYVSIQIGIGGYQTAEATTVSKNGYGDCKALANYTMALLKTSGIKSFLTLVNAGEGIEDINTSFVDVQFNHVILCVPLQKDTIWLECTNQTLPFNYLGSFTCNRHALILTPEGGKLVKTPGFKKEQNTIARSGAFFFNTAGTLSARIKTNYSGYYFGSFSRVMSLQSEDEMKRTLYASLDYPDFNVTSVKYTEVKSENPTSELQYQVSIKAFGATNGKQIYFSPSLSKMSFLPPDTVLLKVPVSDITVDSLTYWIPEGFSVGSIPEDVRLKTDFGSYFYDVENNGERIIFYRRLELSEGLISEEKYDQFKEFLNKVAKTDRSLIILNKPVIN
jgi:hypothetical protein